jgi:hypothetical protein
MKEGKLRTHLAHWLCVLAVLLELGSETAHGDPRRVRDYAVEIQAVLSENPPQIILKWPAVSDSTSYKISRKRLNDSSWTEMGTISGDQNSVTDGSVSVGSAFEYQIIRNTSAGYTGYGYIYAGLKVPVTEKRGTIILLVEKSIAAALPQEISRWMQDAIGDGWFVIRHEVTQDQKPEAIQQLIRADYKADPSNVKAVFLLGHVPVAYSGDIAPDGHPNHQGAWPADIFYADVEGAWTDTTVNSTGAERQANWNVPGDGKFDQSEPPVPIKLQLGRVDLSNLTCFSNKTPSRNEIDLTRQYLEKDHRFRSGLMPINRQALIYDDFDYGLPPPEPYLAFAWRNFSGLIGGQTELIAGPQFIPKVHDGSYLLGSAMAGGSYTHLDFFADSDDFAFGDFNIVFTTLCGSYFGDWNNESNFLRAILGASGATLVSAFAAQPPWLFHTMGLGEPIGTSAQMTQNNKEGGLYPPQIRHAGLIHVALMGDPTLRLHPVLPPVNFKGTQQAGVMTLSWERPSADGLQGYYLYKANSSAGPYARVASDLLTGNSFQDSSYKDGQTYMLKAVALTEVPSGAYFNGSQGVFFPDALQGQSQGTVPAAPADLAVINAAASGVLLRWVSKSVNQTGYALERAPLGATGWQAIGTAAADATEFTDGSIAAPGNFVYRVRAFNASGYSGYSNEARASTLKGEGTFIIDDHVTGGNWKGVYGAQYYYILGDSSNLPPSISITSSNLHAFDYGVIKDGRGLWSGVANHRTSSCWVVTGKGVIDMDFYEESIHRMAFYLVDWSDQQKSIKVELSDPTTGQLLDARTFSDYVDGVYLVYDVRRRARFTLTTLSGPNNTIFGMFFDKPVLLAPQFSPGPGIFPGRINVQIASPVAGAEARYTVDGTIPTQSSALFNGPIQLLQSATFTARCFKAGYDPGPVATASYVDSMRTRESELGRNDNLQGNWPGTFGKEGYWIPFGGKALPGFIEQSINGGQEWIWADNPSDGRALYKAADKTARVASCLYGDGWTLNLSVWDTKSHALALYFLDWDQRVRHQVVDVFDANGTRLSSYDLQDFSRGKYLILNMQGSLQLKFTKIAGDNAVLNGIFFDAAPISLNQPIPLRQAILPLSVSQFGIRITGEPGLGCCVDTSADLNAWTCLSTNILSTNPLDLNFPRGSADRKRFFRAHYVQ